MKSITLFMVNIEVLRVLMVLVVLKVLVLKVLRVHGAETATFLRHSFE